MMVHALGFVMFGLEFLAHICCSLSLRRAISCEPPKNPKNGLVIYSSLEIDSELKYECVKGFKPKNSIPISCTPDGTWSEIMECIVTTCDPPKDPANGIVIYLSLEYGSLLKYGCQKGFKPKTNNPIFCTADGTWSEEVDCIAITCGAPVNPENGHVTSTSLEYGSQLKYKCQLGYRPKNSNPIFCMEDGSWSDGIECIAIYCNPPQNPENGIAIYSSVSYGSELKYRCQIGFTPKNNNPISCMEDGTWSEKMECIATSCDAPENPENGIVIYSSLSYGFQLKYRCQIGFTPKSNKPISCMEDGTWSGEMECIAVSCDPPKNPENGYVIYSSLTYGSRLKYICQVGFTRQNYNPIICTEHGAWSGEMKCKAVTCDPPDSPENGNVIYTSLEYGSQLNYTCQIGYTPKHNYSIHCTENGTWSEEMECVESCAIPLVDNGRIGKYIPTAVPRRLAFKEIAVGTRLLDNERLFLHCNEGFSPLGSKNWQEKITCSKGMWTEKPYCKPKVCEVDRVENGDIKKLTPGKRYVNWKTLNFETSPVVYENVSPGSVVYENSQLFLFCNDGFSFKGSGQNAITLVCLKGEWKQKAECLPTDKTHTTTFTPVSSTSAMKSQTRVIVGEEKSTLIPSTPTMKEINFTEDSVQSTMKLFLTTVTIREFKTESLVPVNTQSAVTTPTATESSPGIRLHPSGDDSDNQMDLQGSDNCSCKLIVDNEDLIAYMDDRKLEKQSNIEKGSIVKFRCRESGFYQLIGKEEFICEDCQTWYSGKLSSCIPPARGNTVVLFDTNVHITVNGTLETKKGEDILLICIAIELAEYPTWNVPSKSRAKIIDQQIDREKDILYVSVIEITYIDVEHAGLYTCGVKNFHPTKLDIRIIRDQCKKLEQQGFLQISYTNGQAIGSFARFHCLNPSQRRGVTEAKCLENGKWSDPIPTCTNITCKELSQADLLNVSYTNGQEIGSFAHFHCLNSSQRKGVSQARCLNNGEWSDPAPTCKRITCKELEQSNLLSISYTNFQEIDSFASFQCLNQSQLRGVSQARCLENGRWSDPVPTCMRITCKELEENNLLSISYTNTQEIGSFASFDCLNRSQIRGASQARCLENGKWSDPIPTCMRITCKELEQNNLLSISYTSFHEIDSFASFHCLNRSQIRGASQARCLENGKWSDPIPTCMRVTCKEMKQTELLRISYTNAQEIDSTANFYCLTQSQRRGVSRTRCLENGEWSDPIPTCMRITCKELEQTSLLRISYTNAQQIGSFANFNCLNESQQIGVSQTRCLENREWSDPMPACIIITCKEMEQNDLLRISYTNYQEIGSFARFHCLNPSKRKGTSEVRCLENGEWSDVMPVCVTRPCIREDLLSILPEEVTPNFDDLPHIKMPYNSTVRLSCKENMRLVGNTVANCGVHGDWEVKITQCTYDCLPLMTPLGSNLIVTPRKNLYKIGQFVTLSCPPGQRLNKDVELIMCLISGWSELMLPECEDIEVNDY